MRQTPSPREWMRSTNFNVIDEQTMKMLAVKPALQTYNKSTYAYGYHPIESNGIFTTKVKYNDKQYPVEFVVMKGTCGNVLSYQDSINLGLVTMYLNLLIKQLDFRMEKCQILERTLSNFFF